MAKRFLKTTEPLSPVSIRQMLACLLRYCGLRPTLFLDLDNQGGSVEHYFHFLLGFLIPLVLTHDTLCRGRLRPNIYVRSCAIMDVHLDHLNLTGLHIIPKEEHARPIPSLDGWCLCAKRVRRMTVKGLDHPDLYNSEAFDRARSLVLRHLQIEVNRAKQTLASDRRNYPSESNPLIVLIGRDKPDQYYKSERSERRAAGSERRDIPNFPQLASAVASVYPSAVAVKLEKHTLAYQIALFSQADIIIGQHGAALLNVLWARPKSTLMEIMPDPLMSRPLAPRYFSELAECMGLNYIRVPQRSTHADVDVPDLMTRLDHVVSKTGALSAAKHR